MTPTKPKITWEQWRVIAGPEGQVALDQALAGYHRDETDPDFAWVRPVVLFPSLPLLLPECLPPGLVYPHLCQLGGRSCGIAKAATTLIPLFDFYFVSPESIDPPYGQASLHVFRRYCDVRSFLEGYLSPYSNLGTVLYQIPEELQGYCLLTPSQIGSFAYAARIKRTDVPTTLSYTWEKAEFPYELPDGKLARLGGILRGQQFYRGDVPSNKTPFPLLCTRLWEEPL